MDVFIEVQSLYTYRDAVHFMSIVIIYNVFAFELKIHAFCSKIYFEIIN